MTLFSTKLRDHLVTTDSVSNLMSVYQTKLSLGNCKKNHRYFFHFLKIMSNVQSNLLIKNLQQPVKMLTVTKKRWEEKSKIQRRDIE